MKTFKKSILITLILSTLLSFNFANAGESEQIRLAVYEPVGDVNLSCNLNQVTIFADGKAIYRMANLGEIANIKVPSETKELLIRNISVGNSHPCFSAVLEKSDGSSLKTQSTNGVDFKFSLSGNGVGRD